MDNCQKRLDKKNRFLLRITFIKTQIEIFYNNSIIKINKILYVEGGNKMPKVKNTKAKTDKSSKDVLVKASVKRLYNQSAPLLICEALLFGIAAIFMVIKPVAILTALTFVIGIALVLFGLYRTIAGFIVSHDIGGGWFDVVFGLVNVVLGVLFCIYPVGSVISLVYVFVLLFLFKSLRALIFSINMIRAKFGHYWFDFVMSIILIALAVFLLVYPVAGAVVMIYYLAITLLLYAAADVYMYIELLRLKKLV